MNIVSQVSTSHETMVIIIKKGSTIIIFSLYMFNTSFYGWNFTGVTASLLSFPGLFSVLLLICFVRYQFFLWFPVPLGSFPSPWVPFQVDQVTNYSLYQYHPHVSSLFWLFGLSKEFAVCFLLFFFFYSFDFHFVVCWNSTIL